MKKAILALFVFLVVFGHRALAENPRNSSTEPYRIGLNDVLDVSIIKPDKYSTSLTVAPDGTINFPYIGNVAVRGATVLEVQEKIREGISSRMTNPVVLVSLKESRNRLFYAYGEVAKPGPYPLNENLTVMEALSMAGGFSKFASASKIKVIRHKPDGSGKEIIKVDINAAMGGKTDQDIFIEPGDVITVSEGLF